MGQNLGIEREIEIAAEAGYDGIEVWIRSIEAYLEAGGTLTDLKKKASDLGLSIENAIGFAQWIVDDNDTRSAALEQARREMDMLSALGCTRIAAPPAGATKIPGLSLDAAAERFRALCDIGSQNGVMPQLEIWGFSANLSKLSEVLYVASECGHPDTRILPDAYHLYKGGSDFDGLKLLSRNAVEIFHLNDYPSNPGREEIGDADRVYPGEGVAPLGQILEDLAGAHPTILSLELFNRSYWKDDPLAVAKRGLEAMKNAVPSSLN
ncbi:MAG: sugar phosphate isomerase/epimerase [Saprospiraceae bacterium]|nr:sugar phosphate isomerase/epimerase [Saprospiraceae bacterium]